MTEPKERNAPDIELSPIPEGYGELLVHGFDWYQECLDFVIPELLWESLKTEKARAVDLDSRRKTPIAYQFGDMQFQLMPTGATGGKEFILENEEYRVELGALNRQWSVSWRARSAAIWASDLQELRARIYGVFEKAGFKPHENSEYDYIRITRVDYCFDIHSKAFTREMVPEIIRQVVCPSEVKAKGDFIVQADSVETLTVALGSPCQLQIYNKTKEITEASGKTWLYDHWEIDASTGEVRENIPDEWADVWRVEIRMRSKWLKPKKVNKPAAFFDNMWVLIAEGLYNRRLCSKTKDTNRGRWPVHPLFSIILEEIENPRAFLPIDRRAEGKAEILDEIIVRNITGSLRSLAMLRDRETGKFNKKTIDKILMQVLTLLETDPDHVEKIRRALEKYSLVDAAK